MIRWTPGVFQHYIDKSYELRVTVIGHRVFAVRINSQKSIRGRVDWREAQLQPLGRECDLSFEPETIPLSLSSSCLQLARSLGLAYGAIDLIVTPDHEYVFLEINSSGQFLWIDEEVGLPLLDAMSEMLMQGRLDYDWSPHAPGVRFDEEFVAAVKERELRSMEEHSCDMQEW